MKTLTPFPNEDLKLIRWEIFFIVVSILVCAGIYLGSNYLLSQSQTQLRAARTEFERAQSSVELIEEEEATIIEYIDRYEEILNEKAFEVEDRLQLLETFINIRANYDLFPIDFVVDSQASLGLQYGSDIRDPGRPIILKSSPIALNLALLHEEDLTRLLEALDSSPGIFQTKKCELDVRGDSKNFDILAQHQNANCQLLWHTFQIDTTTRRSRD